MRTLPIAGSLLAFFAAFATYGCALDVSGLEPTTTSTSGTPTTSSVGGAGPSSASASGTGGDASGPGGSGGTTVSSSNSSSTGCVMSPEVCDDGLDNDCDGMIDCADTECTTTAGYACSPPAPAGWTVVSFVPGSALSCPVGYGSATQLTSPNVSVAGECACSCGGMAPSNPCTTGTISFAIGTGNNSCTSLMVTHAVTGQCDAMGATVSGNAWDADITPVPLQKLACAAGATTVPALQKSDSVSCAAAAKAGGGCSTPDAVCLPVVQAAAWCIQRSGDFPCPTGLTKQTVYAPQDVDDNRSCGSCACESAATQCKSPGFTAYDDSGCSAHGVSVTVDGTCTNADNSGNFKNNKYFKYTAQADTMNCSVKGAPPSLGGTVNVANPITICCQP